MLNSSELQQSYIKLYKALRNYIWPYNTVELLGFLEVAVYDRFPDIDKVKSCFNKLKFDILNEISSDKDISDAVKEFESIIYTDENIFTKLYQVQEVVLI